MPCSLQATLKLLDVGSHLKDSCLSKRPLNLVYKKRERKSKLKWRKTQRHNTHKPATDDRDEPGFVRGKTRWATSSSRLATLLAREHAGENRRVRLIGQNGARAGATYSPRLLKGVFKALGKQGPTAAHKNRKTTMTISKEICSTQSRSRKAEDRKLIGC